VVNTGGGQRNEEKRAELNEKGADRNKRGAGQFPKQGKGATWKKMGRGEIENRRVSASLSLGC